MFQSPPTSDPWMLSDLLGFCVLKLQGILGVQDVDKSRRARLALLEHELKGGRNTESREVADQALIYNSIIILIVWINDL